MNRTVAIAFEPKFFNQSGIDSAFPTIDAKMHTDVPVVAFFGMCSARVGRNEVEEQSEKSRT